ncbi:MAG: HNH endonuclease [Eubacterium sp.]|nr:HNH endonuclease [Eubacterium sp.]
MRNQFSLSLPESEELDIGSLSRAFDNKSECYKLFWFQAVLRRAGAGQDEISYEDLVDDMIADAWYMVTEYHLNLGPSDTLEKVVCYIYEHENISPAEKKEKILSYLRHTEDKQVLKYKRILTLNVPYRLQAPFLKTDQSFWKAGERKLADQINSQKHLIYYFGVINGLHTSIHIQPEWMAYFSMNQEILLGWLRCDMIEYLQRRNPSVPGISEKIDPPRERNLSDVQKYWKMLISIRDIHEIYDNEDMREHKISIDHFVPWSFVAHDEFWNLHPTTRSINSSKSNYLPEWDRYFSQFSTLEYLSYQTMWENDQLLSQFEKCARDHLNNVEVRQRLYRPGQDKETFSRKLESVIRPVYESALQCGFKEWVYRG